MNDTEQKSWDIFISHASEDKNSFVAPLANALSAFGVNVWYDEFELKLGDSLSRSIDAGLARSNYGLVVLSPAFMSKKWPDYELRGLTSREIAGGKVILPVWQNVSFDQVVAFSPTLADKLAIKSDSLTPVEAAVKIIETIRPEVFTQIQRRLAYKLAIRDAKVQQIEIEKVHPGPIRHPELSDELVGRIRLLRASLLGVYTHSMEFWIDGFKRDAHPSQEVSWWEHVAAVHREYAAMARLTKDQHQAAYEAVFSIAMGDEASFKKHSTALPEGAPEVILSLFNHKLPTYDIDEKSPDASVAHSEEVIRSAQNYDKEQFPKDLPEDLIRELLDLTERKQ